MKIIQIDSFDRDEIGDKLIAENVVSYWGSHIVTMLNNKFSRDTSDTYFMLVVDNHKLKEDFVP